MLGWEIGPLLEASAKDVEATRVDCGTCPVSLQCITSNGGNGWRYECCGAVGVDIVDDHGGALTLVMDCSKNAFQPRVRASDQPVCPLCSGDFVKGHVMEMTLHHRYVPTVHAKVPVRTRLALWRKTLPQALERKRHIEETNK